MTINVTSYLSGITPSNGPAVIGALLVWRIRRRPA